MHRGSESVTFYPNNIWIGFQIRVTKMHSTSSTSAATSTIVGGHSCLVQATISSIRRTRKNRPSWVGLIVQVCCVLFSSNRMKNFVGFCHFFHQQQICKSRKAFGEACCPFSSVV